MNYERLVRDVQLALRRLLDDRRGGAGGEGRAPPRVVEVEFPVSVRAPASARTTRRGRGRRVVGDALGRARRPRTNPGPVDSPQRHPAFAPGWLKRSGFYDQDFTPVYFDGYYSSDDWRPVFKTIVREGEGLIFPPFMIHRTYAVRGPDGSTADNPSGDLRRSCTDSLTMQFDYPLPSAYLRAYWPRLSSVPESLSCIPTWGRALALEPEFLRHLSRETCGSYMRSKRPRNAAVGRADGGSLDAMGNATHLSIAGDLFEGWQEKDLRLALDAAHALTSLEPIADGGRRDAVVSKDDLRRMLARLDRARSKFST
ncbi:MAG: hypothetical protein VX563_09670, partial [Planctomycetota bacterium]|nr:hypothetical protein [Planctomycetota bacterium]